MREPTEKNIGELAQVIETFMADGTVKFDAPTEVDPKKFLINDPTVLEGTFAVNVIPWFPFTINILPDVSITLTADGKWEGSIEALRDAMAKTTSNYSDGTMRILLWLLLREMESDRRFW